MLTLKNLKYTHSKYCGIPPVKIDKNIIKNNIIPTPAFKSKPLEVLTNKRHEDTEAYIQSRILQDREQNKISVVDQNKINYENMKIKNRELRAAAISKLLINAF